MYADGVVRGQATTLADLVHQTPLAEGMLLSGIFCVSTLMPSWFEFADLIPTGFWGVMIFAGSAPLLLGVLLVISVLMAAITTWCIRRVGGVARFKSVFCLIIFLEAVSSLPSIVTSLVGDRSWEGWWFALILDLSIATWFFAVFFKALRVTHDLSKSQACKAVLPVVIVSCSLLILSWTYFPPSLYSAQRWEQAFGERIIVYYPKGQPDPDRVIKESGKILRRVSDYWRVEPTADLIRVFLFPTFAAHHKVSQDKTLAGAAHSEKMAISLVYGEWNKIERIVAHELTHLVTHQRIAKFLPALLNEGIAAHTETVLHFAADSANYYFPYRHLSLLDLASDESFHAKKRDVQSHYSHAAAFVRDIIREYGVAKLKDFCRRLSDRREEEFFFGDDRNQFSEVFQEVYGIPLLEWERTWRASWKKAIDGTSAPYRR